MLSHAEIESIFYPRAVAVVGVSRSPRRHDGTGSLVRLQRAGFAGPIYPINPFAQEVQGLPAYPTQQRAARALVRFIAYHEFLRG